MENAGPKPSPKRHFLELFLALNLAPGRSSSLLLKHNSQGMHVQPTAAADSEEPAPKRFRYYLASSNPELQRGGRIRYLALEDGVRGEVGEDRVLCLMAIGRTAGWMSFKRRGGEGFSSRRCSLPSPWALGCCRLLRAARW